MTERTKLILWSGILTGLVLLIGGAQYYFLWHTRIFVRQKEMKELDEKIAGMQQKKQKIPSLREQRQDLIENEQKYQKKLPSLEENTPSEFMEQLHAISRKVGVNVSQYNPSGEGDTRRGGGSGYRTITMSISAQGETYRLFRYIWALENQDRLMRVKEFSLSVDKKTVSLAELRSAGAVTQTSRAGGGPSGSIEKYIGQMNLTITIYIYTPPEDNA